MAREDKAYTDWLRTQPCAACGAHGVQVHHPRHDVAMGKRAHDNRAIPLCHDCHEDIQQYRNGWTKLRLREWCDRVAALCRAAYLGRDTYEEIPF